jgi:fatty acid synthase subunit alpha, fungi type
MASGDIVSDSVNIQKVQDDVLKLWSVVESQPSISLEQKNRIRTLYQGIVRALRKGLESRGVTSRNRRPSNPFVLRSPASRLSPLTKFLFYT